MFATSFSFLQQKAIRMTRVNLGECVIDVPVARIEGNRPGKTLVVTAGMDGDEYAGIAAAYRLIEQYADRDFAGRIVIVPIVNAPGFDGECSVNPLDGKYPKEVFPGRSNGSSTERLMHWFSSTILEGADCWLDLHSGAMTEGLNAFLWLYRTGIETVDARSRALIEEGTKTRGWLGYLPKNIIQRVPVDDILMQAPLAVSRDFRCGSLCADRIVYEPVGARSQAGQLARRGCWYVMAESGERGRVDEKDVSRHCVWANAVMRNLEMIPETLGECEIDAQRQLSVFDSLSYVYAPFDGVWRLGEIDRASVKKGDVIGECMRLDGGKKTELRATATGVPLWWKETMKMKKGEVLFAVGRRR